MTDEYERQAQDATQQVQEAEQSALQQIARIHEHAVNAVWQGYPTPQRSAKHGDPHDNA